MRASMPSSPAGVFISREVYNYQDIQKWAHSQGFTHALSGKDMHVTIGYSNDPVEWRGGSQPEEHDEGILVFGGEGRRSVMQLGDQGLIALAVKSPTLSLRWADLVSKGLPTKFDSFLCHISFTRTMPPGMDLRSVRPFQGVVCLGPEKFEPSLEATGKRFMDGLVEVKL